MHICGKCEKSFKSEKAYMEHTCEVTTVTPKDVLSMGLHYEAIQQAALKRGVESQKKTKKK